MAVIKTETPSNDTLVVEFAEFNQTVGERCRACRAQQSLTRRGQ
jgi:hypothetical protein